MKLYNTSTSVLVILFHMASRSLAYAPLVTSSLTTTTVRPTTGIKQYHQSQQEQQNQHDLYIRQANSETSTSQEYLNDTAFRDAILNATNTYRKQHNASALVWNTTLEDFAEKVSEGCVFEHSVCIFDSHYSRPHVFFFLLVVAIINYRPW